MKTRELALVSLSLLIMSLGCGDDPGGPGADTPAITGVDPTAVTAGTVVTVTGTDFGTSGQLFVNGIEVAAASWSDTSIVFTVPTGITGTEILLRVTSGGQDSADFAVAYTEPTGAPVIASCDPPNLTEGSEALLHGNHFGNTGELRINSAPAATTSWSNTLIIFTVPPGLSGRQLNITVHSNGMNSGSFFVPFTEATERQLTFDGLGCNFPCWGAGTNNIYFSAEAPSGTMAFYKVPIDGGETTLLYDGPGNDYFLDIQYYQAGATIWVSDRPEFGNTDEDWEIRKGGAGFNPQGWVYPTLVASNQTTERLPAWSHTVRLNINCAWVRDTSGGPPIIVINNYLTGPEDLVSGYMPCFDPNDGTYLAYLRSRTSFGHEIMKIRAEAGATPEVVYSAETTGHTALAWSKNGDIAYKRGIHIWIMDEDGTNHRKLTEGHEAEFAPKFSPGGTWVVFTRNTTTEHEVFVARVPN